jgi:lysyl-tRNA synthetase class 2
MTARTAAHHATTPASKGRARPLAARSRRTPFVVASLVRLVGLIDIVSALTPADRARLARLTNVLPAQVSDAAAAATTVTGVLLLLLGHGLRRRKRRAWLGASALLSISIALHVVKGLDVEEALASAALLLVLVMARREFDALGDPRTRWVAAYAAGGLLVVSVGLGLLLVGLRLGTAVGGHPFTTQLEHVLLGLVGVPGPLRFSSDRDADVVQATLAGLGLLTVLTVTFLALRPAEPVATLEPSDESALRGLLAQHGRRDSLGYFALRRDKSIVWSRTRKAAIAYRVVSGVALASGDPLGDPEAWPGAIEELARLASAHAWVPAVMGCSETGAAAYARAGLAVLEVGDEAVLDVADFSLDGRAMRGVRQAVARVARAGYQARVRRLAEISEDERDAIRRAAAAWRGAPTERGFSMALGRLGDPADGECVLATAERDGELHALLHFVPWGDDGLSLDVMRRDRSADNGLNEFLIAHTVREAARLGITRLSLNFAVFRNALERGERLGAGPILRAWRSVLVFVSRWFQIDSLYRFNAKFRPVWEPRYVCYPSAADVPRVALAALEAEAFIAWPMAEALQRLVGH